VGAVVDRARGLLARKPSNVSWEAAAAFPVPALTAEQVLSEGLGVTKGERVLVHGSGGVTGGLLVSLAARDAEVIATAGPASRDRVKKLGASQVLDYHDPGWPEAVVAITGGRGVDAAANAAPDGAATALRAVRNGGRLATITSDLPDDERDIRLTSVYVRADGSQLQRLSDLLEAGHLEISVAAAFDHSDAASALAAATEGHAGRAIVLTFGAQRAGTSSRA
jgi:NADPH:quinone reductase-like Zn-dependent oxidoreductase